MEGFTATDSLTILQHCFPTITTTLVGIIDSEMKRFDPVVGQAAARMYVRTEPEFVLARFVSLLREHALRQLPSSSSQVADVKRLNARLDKARDLMRQMRPDELEELKRESLAPIAPPLFDRLMQLPALHCHGVALLVADRYFPDVESEAKHTANALR